MTSAIVGTIEFSLGEWELCRVDDCVKLNEKQLAALDREWEICDRGADAWCIGHVATIDSEGNLKVWYDPGNSTEAQLAVMFSDALAELAGDMTSWDRADAARVEREAADAARADRKGYSSYDRELQRMRLSR